MRSLEHSSRPKGNLIRFLNSYVIREQFIRRPRIRRFCRVYGFCHSRVFLTRTCKRSTKSRREARDEISDIYIRMLTLAERTMHGKVRHPRLYSLPPTCPQARYNLQQCWAPFLAANEMTGILLLISSSLGIEKSSPGSLQNAEARSARSCMIMMIPVTRGCALGPSAIPLPWWSTQPCRVIRSQSRPDDTSMQANTHAAHRRLSPH